MGRDEAYFTDAHKFVPERWQRHLADKPHPFSSLPFGYGVRSCLGERPDGVDTDVTHTDVIITDVTCVRTRHVLTRHAQI